MRAAHQLGIQLKRVRGVLLTQLALTIFLALAAFTGGRIMGLSALYGGAVATITNLVFALVVFSGYRAQEPARLVNRLYAAELIKLLVVVAGFALVFLSWQAVNVLVLLGSYLLVQVLPPLLAGRV